MASFCASGRPNRARDSANTRLISTAIGSLQRQDTPAAAEALGALLYSDYIFLFEATGLVLLVAMIGAIVLTHRKTAGDHRGQQDIAKQNRRNPNEATVMKRPTVGEGVEL